MTSGLSMNYEEAYGQLHETSEKRFGGYSTKVSVHKICELVDRIKPARILDYGSGKGYQYLERRIHEQWGGILPYCYDVGVRALRVMPEGKFGGIICNDVMEHIECDDVPEILEQIFLKAEKKAFVFFRIGLTIAKKNKRLPDGRNVHVCLRPEQWWAGKMKRFRRDGLVISVTYDDKIRLK